MKKKQTGFTLIELLAVIVILSMIVVIAIPLVMNIIETSKEGARKLSVLRYAEVIDIAFYEKQILNGGEQFEINVDWVKQNVSMKGNRVQCKEVYYQEPYGVVLHACVVEESQNTYYAASGKVYTSMEDEAYKNIYESLNQNQMEYVDGSGANKPILSRKMLPVIYEDSGFKVADVKEKWYDYDAREWANAVILENGVTKKVGEYLDIATEVAQMYVWIPRYEYHIPEDSIGTSGTPKAIDIKFIHEDQMEADKGYQIHSGFTFEQKNKAGLWMGKFETTGAEKDIQTAFSCQNETCTEKVTIKPSYKSAYGQLYSLFYAGRSVQNQYQLENMDSHMSRYLEWTTASYLTNSIYGRCESEAICTEVTINNSKDYYTGNAGNTVSSSAVSGIENAYDTEKGVLASTTGNITGIYDLSGGALEYVMGVAQRETGEIVIGATGDKQDSGFNGLYNNGEMKTDGFPLPDEKYYDAFTTADPTGQIYGGLCEGMISVNGVKGDYRGTSKELLNDYRKTGTWYHDSVYCVDGYYPWFMLGGYHDSKSGAGIFGMMRDLGRSREDWGFRMILAPQ